MRIFIKQHLNQSQQVNNVDACTMYNANKENVVKTYTLLGIEQPVTSDYHRNDGLISVNLSFAKNNQDDEIEKKDQIQMNVLKTMKSKKNEVKKVEDKMKTKKEKLSNQQRYITASVGITMYPEDGLSVEALMQSAEQAIFEAKI